MSSVIRAMCVTAVVALWSATAFAQDAALIARGKTVFDAQRCSLCHSVAERGNKKGPLDTVGSRLGAADIRKWIVSPKEMKSPTNRKPEMRAYPTIPAADLDALVAYLLSLKGA